MTYAQVTFLNPTTLAIAAAMYLIQELLFSGSCDQEDVETAMLDNSGMCHYLDTYCKKKVVPCRLCSGGEGVLLLQLEARAYHPRAGAASIDNVFAPMGLRISSSGNCRGFTPSEFQMLDFSKMNLSEYLGDIKTKAQNTIQNTVTDKIQQYYEKTRP